ncbi:MAG: hypothetical protein Q9208_007494 [Pyrenodesmia sp. 3 TL-2023]
MEREFKLRPQQGGKGGAFSPVRSTASRLSRSITDITNTPSTPLSEAAAERFPSSLSEPPNWVIDRHPERNRNRYSTEPTPSTHPDPPVSPISSPSEAVSPNPSHSPTQSPSNSHLPHLTPSSAVHQISISHKSITRRVAVAIGSVRFSTPNLLPSIQKHALQKGDVLSVARVAGIMAVKRTADLIPLSHAGLAVEGCTVDLELVGPGESIVTVEPQGEWLTRANIDRWMKEPMSSQGGIKIKVSVETTGKTGVEMEALAGVMGAALTVVDMCKAADKHLLVGDVRVVGKRGGKSGDWGVLVEDEESPPEEVEAASRTKAESTIQESGLTDGGETRSRPLIRRTNDDRNYREILWKDPNGHTILRKSLEGFAGDSGDTEEQEEEQEAELARGPSDDGNLSRRVIAKKQEGVQWKPFKVHGEQEEEEETPEKKMLEWASKDAKEQARLIHALNKESGRLRAPPPPFETPRKVEVKKKAKKGSRKK